MPDSPGLRRAEAVEFVESLSSLDVHADLVKQILVEAKLLSDTYRRVSRHDIPHVREIAGLLDVLKQEVEMLNSPPAYPTGDPSES